MKHGYKKTKKIILDRDNISLDDWVTIINCQFSQGQEVLFCTFLQALRMCYKKKKKEKKKDVISLTFFDAAPSFSTHLQQ